MDYIRQYILETTSILQKIDRAAIRRMIDLLVQLRARGMEDAGELCRLARLNTDMVSLAMRIMDHLASADEQAHYAQRLIAAGKRLQRRANEMAGAVIEGEIVPTNGPLTLPGLTAEPNREP